MFKIIYSNVFIHLFKIKYLFICCYLNLFTLGLFKIV